MQGRSTPPAPVADAPPQPQAPKSFRGLLDAVEASESTTEACTAEIRDKRSVNVELRRLISGACGRQERASASEVALHAELHSLQREAAALWAAHEAPLQERVEEIASASRRKQALEQLSSEQEVDVSSLRSEREELRSKLDWCQNGFGTAFQEHEVMGSQVQGARGREEEAAQRHREHSCSLGEMEKTLASERLRRSRLESEVSEQRSEIKTLRYELVDIETAGHGRISQWWQEQRAHFDVFNSETDALRLELRHGEAALEGQVRESAAWREQAYRAESSICALKGEDVASGLRVLNLRREFISLSSDAGRKVVAYTGGDLRGNLVNAFDSTLHC